MELREIIILNTNIMGCDYYINVYLEIQHVNGISYYFFPTIRGYYPDLECGVYDSDEDENEHYYNSTEYKNLYENITKICLTPRKPIIIYNNHSFTTQSFEMKYLPMIQDKINHTYVKNSYHPIYKDTGTFTHISEVIKITKKEKRYER